MARSLVLVNPYLGTPAILKLRHREPPAGVNFRSLAAGILSEAPNQWVRSLHCGRTIVMRPPAARDGSCKMTEIPPPEGRLQPAKFWLLKLVTYIPIKPGGMITRCSFRNSAPNISEWLAVLMPDTTQWRRASNKHSNRCIAWLECGVARRCG